MVCTLTFRCRKNFDNSFKFKILGILLWPAQSISFGKFNIGLKYLQFKPDGPSSVGLICTFARKLTVLLNAKS